MKTRNPKNVRYTLIIKFDENNQVLNMFLIPISIPTFSFSHSKIFFQLLVPVKFSITTLVPIFKSNFVFLMKLCRNV